MTSSSPKKKKAKLQIDEKFLPADTTYIMRQKNILTLAYWEVSRSWNDRPNAKPMNVGDALTMLNPLSSDNTLPKLAVLSSNLKDKVIEYGTKRNSQKGKKKASADNINGPNNLGTRIYVI